MRIPDYTLEGLRITRHSWDTVTATRQGRDNLRGSLEAIARVWPARADAVADAQWHLEALEQEACAAERPSALAIVKAINRRFTGWRFAIGGPFDGPTFHAMYPQVAAVYAAASSVLAGGPVWWPCPPSRAARRRGTLRLQVACSDVRPADLEGHR